MPFYLRVGRTFGEKIIVNNINELRNIIYEDYKMWEGFLTKNGTKFNKDSFDIKIESHPLFHDGPELTVSIDFVEKGNFMAIGFLNESFS